MSESTEARVIRLFREYIARGEFPDDMRIVFKKEGGMPSERLFEQTELAGPRRVNVYRHRMLETAIPEKASSDLEDAEISDMLRQLVVGLDSLVPRSQARFLPDSVTGSVTIKLGDEETTLFYLIDEEERADQGYEISTEMTQVIQNVDQISNRLLIREGTDDERP